MPFQGLDLVIDTGQPLVQISVKVTHKLAHEPGSYYIKEIIRPKYVHPQKEEAGVMTAELPDTILPKCRANESLHPWLQWLEIIKGLL